MSYLPPTDIHTSDEKIILIMNLPGIKAENLSIYIEAEDLIIEGERASPEGKLLLKELPPDRFRRRFKIESGIDTESISASLTDGRLQIEASRTNRKRKITVTAA